jgi:hypothetical protein
LTNLTRRVSCIIPAILISLTLKVTFARTLLRPLLRSRKNISVHLSVPFRSSYLGIDATKYVSVKALAENSIQEGVLLTLNQSSVYLRVAGSARTKLAGVGAVQELAYVQNA